VSTTQEPTAAVTAVVIVLAEVFKFDCAAGVVCATFESEIALAKMLLLKDCEVAKVTCTA